MYSANGGFDAIGSNVGAGGTGIGWAVTVNTAYTITYAVNNGCGGLTTANASDSNGLIYNGYSAPNGAFNPTPNNGYMSGTYNKFISCLDVMSDACYGFSSINNTSNGYDGRVVVHFCIN